MLKTCLSSFAVCLAIQVASFAAAQDAPAPTSVRVFDEATLTVPSSFKKSAAKSPIIEHEFVVGEGDKTARVTMMGASGGVDANITRWKGQFSGGKADDQKTEQFDVGPWKAHLVELSGTFKDSMGGGPFFGGKTVERPDYAMLGAILVHPQGRTYFIKMTGPQDVVGPNRDAFVEMVKGLK